MWGGLGTHANRPFLKFESTVEERYPAWTILNGITWAKKRAYGVQNNYLYTREELCILTRGRPTFNIPLLPTLRGYPGYNKNYPAKSPYLRRTNVWTDIPEMFRGKIHPTQKPDDLYRVLVETHSNPGDWVLDPCAGSGTTARVCEKLGRNYVIIEREREYLVAAGLLPTEEK
jgi:DNA modification methylase